MNALLTVVASLAFLGGFLLLIYVFMRVVERMDNPKRKRKSLPPEPPPSTASNKDLARYYREVAKYYRHAKANEAEAQYYELLSLGYEDMGKGG